MIPVITAGTSDLAVAEEALLTCKALGQPAVAVNDVGVAGLHRIEPHLSLFRSALGPYLHRRDGGRACPA
ncbi:MAG: hypothetical protein R3C45_17905 [Phycisphaerales bacterium]